MYCKHNAKIINLFQMDLPKCQATYLTASISIITQLIG